MNPQMNPQMEMMMRQQMVRNPKMFAQRALQSGQFNNDELRRNALHAIANNDVNSMKEIVGNVCNEHNVTVEDATQQFRQYYGIR